MTSAWDHCPGSREAEVAGGSTSSAGDRLAFACDQEGRWHAFHQPASPDGVRRFDELRERLANFQLAPLRSVALVVLSLVLFDLVLRIEDLRRL
jgi:hypothetical protein